MATPPSFTAGSVLTAAQMNAVGLWLVKSQTVGSGVSSITVSNAFSAEYDNYLIQMSGGTGTTNTVMNFRLGSVTSGYRFAFLYNDYINAAGGVGTTNAGAIQYAGQFTATGSYCNVHVFSPYLTTPTRIVADGSNVSTFSGNVTGFEPTAASYTSFTLLVDSGTRTGGTVYVYGYRKG